MRGGVDGRMHRCERLMITLKGVSSSRNGETVDQLVDFLLMVGVCLQKRFPLGVPRCHSQIPSIQI